MSELIDRRADVSIADDLSESFRSEAPALLGYFIRRVDIREDAADLVSETFLAAWKSARRDDIDPAMRRAWLYGIARKVLSQHRRGRVRRSALAGRLRTTLAIDPSANLDGAHKRAESDLAADVRDLIRQLPALDQEVITLVYWEGFSQQEVATIVGKPAATVRSRLARARTTLRAQLGDAGTSRLGSG